MRTLVILAIVVAVVVAAPRKPTKSFPKKYEAAVHGVKDHSYIVYHHAADEDLVVPELNPFDYLLLPPLPRLPLPEDSSYTGLEDAVGKDALSPPPVDTYSSVSGVSHSALVPPPVSPAPKAPSSYLSFDGPTEEPLKAPPTSSYAQTPKDASGSEVLSSLAAMIQALPHISSYSTYQTDAEPNTQAGDLARVMLPPPASSSYSSVPSSQPSLTPAQEVPMASPSTGLTPPQ